MSCATYGGCLLTLKIVILALAAKRQQSEGRWKVDEWAASQKLWPEGLDGPILGSAATTS